MTKKNSMKMTILLLFSLNYAPLLATQSLMFSKKEHADILSKRTQEHLYTLKNKEDCLECNGIIFQDEHNWNVWINGRKIESTCPHCTRQHLKISDVKNNKIRLEWIHKGKKHLITIGPNQYYNAALSKVITINTTP